MGKKDDDSGGMLCCIFVIMVVVFIIFIKYWYIILPTIILIIILVYVFKKDKIVYRIIYKRLNNRNNKILCRECKTIIHRTDAVFCPYCGAKFKNGQDVHEF